MAISLEYRFTFINVLEEMDYERDAALRRRASSLPPARRIETESNEAEEADKKDGEYVQTLTEKLPCIFGAKVADEEILSRNLDKQDAKVAAPATADAGIQSWSTSAMDDTSSEEVIPCSTATQKATPHINSIDSELSVSRVSSLSTASNPGSVGHPELCRRPCIYFAAGQCRNSTDCNFCHLSHAHRSATLDKNQRQMIKELTKHEFLSLLVRCLRTKAQGNFEDEAKEVLELFEEQLTKEVAQEGSKVGAKANNLERALARMTFFSVASLTTRAQFDKVFLERCKVYQGRSWDSLRKLRVHFN